MSNPDLPGPYWREQDEAAYQARRARPASSRRDESRWDDGGGGWGDHRRHGPSGSEPRRQDPYGGNGAGSARGSHRAPGNGFASGGGWQPDATWTGMIAGRLRAASAARGTRGQDRPGRFSQTAEDLRSRLGVRGSRTGRGGEAWSDAAFDSATGYRNGSAASRTALRQRGDVWPGGQRGSRSWPPGQPWAGRGGGSGGGGGGRWTGGPRSYGERFKQWLRSGDWWRHWTWKKALGVLFGVVAGFVLLSVIAFFVIYARTPIPTASELTANWQSSTVYYANGQQLGTFNNNVNGVSLDRLLLTSDQVPMVMTQAMTAAEDRHFYTEGGVSVTGLLRAAYQDVFGHGNLQGGSTLTMQYAKNYYNGVNSGQNLSTKLKEVFIAMKLGHARSKAWVMTNYLNTVPFGPTTYGLGAAAENYFNVNLTNPGTTLTLSQAAMLAAMPNSPGFFNPNPSAGAGYRALVSRWHYVLENMVRDGNISQKLASEQVFPQLTPPPSGNGETGYSGYLMSMVQQQLEAPPAVGGYGLTKQQIDTGGYRITTTFDPNMVTALAQSIQHEQAAMSAYGRSGFKPYDRIGAVLEDPKTGAILAVYGGPGYGSSDCATSDCWINMAESPQPVGSSFKVYVLSAAVNEGMNVFSSQLNGFSPIWIPEKSTSTMLTQMTLSATSPPTGVSPQAVGGYSGNIYYFKFDEANENSGKPLPVNQAAAISSDPAFEDLAHRDGIDNVVAMAKAFGVGQNAFVQPCSVPGSGSGDQAQIIQDCNDMTGPVNGLAVNFGTTNNSKTALANGTPGSPAIALGENPLTPVEQATTMATLADDGIYHTPHVIGTLQQNGATLPSHITTTQVLSPQAAADVDWALSFDNNMGGGTAEGNVSFRRGGVIGKTGTLGSGANASQAWFLGATPSQDALAVDLFTNSPAIQNLNNLPSVGGTPGSQGGGWPATIWNYFMTTQFGNTPASPMFATANGSPFVAWIQAQPNTPPVCQYQFGQTPGQGQQNCTCPNGASWCSSQGQQNCPPGQAQGPGQGQGQTQPCTNNSTPPTQPTICAPFPFCTAAMIFGSPPTNPRGSPTLTAGQPGVLATRRTQAV